MALRAYGWDDLAESAAKSGFCECLLDYEAEEDELAASGQPPVAAGERSLGVIAGPTTSSPAS